MSGKAAGSSVPLSLGMSEVTPSHELIVISP